MIEEKVVKRGRPSISDGTRKDNEFTREEKAHMPQGRRIPLSSERQYITYPDHLKEKGWHYHFTADDGGNIEMRLNAGYEYVLNEDGSKYVRKGRDGVSFYLMRQPQQYRDEDLLLKREASSTMMKAEQKLNAGEYIPDGRKSKIQRDSDLIDPLAD